VESFVVKESWVAPTWVAAVGEALLFASAAKAELVSLSVLPILTNMTRTTTVKPTATTKMMTRTRTKNMQHAQQESTVFAVV
jgi:hypothetical protein